ncbi:hypothetical protein Cadr_000030634 [Camelus dromedarius]|uniref:Uncharacterized protein n=1 Tax=Camelus dromedarius TaxID=9838 RepID=A0A5N4C4B8_CAMDR|nr:hypothetical protein Cadr_000030634 [Camelus dromedarius]
MRSGYTAVRLEKLPSPRMLGTEKGVSCCPRLMPLGGPFGVTVNVTVRVLCDLAGVTAIHGLGGTSVWVHFINVWKRSQMHTNREEHRGILRRWQRSTCGLNRPQTGVLTVSPPRPLSAQGGSLTHRNRGFASQGLLTGQRKSSFPSFSLTALLPDLSPCLHSRLGSLYFFPVLAPTPHGFQLHCEEAVGTETQLSLFYFMFLRDVYCRAHPYPVLRSAVHMGGRVSESSLAPLIPTRSLQQVAVTFSESQSPSVCTRRSAAPPLRFLNPLATTLGHSLKRKSTGRISSFSGEPRLRSAGRRLLFQLDVVLAVRTVLVLVFSRHQGGFAPPAGLQLPAQEEARPDERTLRAHLSSKLGLVPAAKTRGSGSHVLRRSVGVRRRRSRLWLTQCCANTALPSSQVPESSPVEARCLFSGCSLLSLPSAPLHCQAAFSSACVLGGLQRLQQDKEEQGNRGGGPVASHGLPGPTPRGRLELRELTSWPSIPQLLGDGDVCDLGFFLTMHAKEVFPSHPFQPGAEVGTGIRTVRSNPQASPRGERQEMGTCGKFSGDRFAVFPGADLRGPGTPLLTDSSFLRSDLQPWILQPPGRHALPAVQRQPGVRSESVLKLSSSSPGQHVWEREPDGHHNCHTQHGHLLPRQRHAAETTAATTRS